MKRNFNYFYTFFLMFMCFGAIVFMSCNGSRSERKAMQAQIDSLEAANASQANQLKEISGFMTIVSEGLDSIAEQEQLLMGNGKGMEEKKMTKEELKANLDAFAALLERQRNRIAQLEDSLQGRGKNMAHLRSIIVHLNQQLDEKTQTIAALQESLHNKNVDIQRLTTQVRTLTTSNQQLTEEVNRQGEALVTQSEIINECYVKIGTKKELQQAGVLAGGLLSKKKLDVTNFSQAGFMKVDIRSFTELDVQAKKIQILTQMPASSYTITSNGSSSKLQITNPTLFWSVSSYLVIQKK